MIMDMDTRKYRDLPANLDTLARKDLRAKRVRRDITVNPARTARMAKTVLLALLDPREIKVILANLDLLANLARTA